MILMQRITGWLREKILLIGGGKGGAGGMAPPLFCWPCIKVNDRRKNFFGDF